MEIETLKKNRDANKLGFQIENSALSMDPLFSVGWITSKKPSQGSIPVKTIDWRTFSNKYCIEFNTIVADCEGSIVKVIDSFPEMLVSIQKIIIEHDFQSQADLERFESQMENNKFVRSHVYLKSSHYAPGQGWTDGVLNDPVFVSFWEKKS